MGPYKNDSGQKTGSIWMDGVSPPLRSPLSKDCNTDVCVVGAGIAGITTAYLLSREGLRVTVLDSGEVGSGQTALTTAHLTNAMDDRFYTLENYHGETGARLTAESHTAAINQIESIIQKENIECEFRRVDGYLFFTSGDSHGIMEEERDAAIRAGLIDVTVVPRSPIQTFGTDNCLRFPNQAQFHPLRYLHALTDAIERQGGQIHTGTPVVDVEGGISPHVMTRDGHMVYATAVVVATNSPINNVVAIHTKQAAYRSYVIGALIPKDSVPWELYWDTEDPYHYVRLAALPATHPSYGTHDVLIVGGEDHKTGQDEDPAHRHDALVTWTRERFPMITSVPYKWSGQVMEPMDGLAFIGENPSDRKNIYVATGDSGQGMTHGTIAGMLITDLIQGRESPWRTLYNPSRLSFRAFSHFAKENANVAKRYAVDWTSPGDVASIDAIAPESGAVVRRGLKKVAVYRDAVGALHEHSAVCTHLGCIVQWNGLEKTWDCPCHGSRFNAEGKVINGPAHEDLAPADQS